MTDRAKQPGRVVDDQRSTPAGGSGQSGDRTCHYCGLPIKPDEKAVEARTKNGWAHFTCWYDGGPFERDMLERDARLTQEAQTP